MYLNGESLLNMTLSDRRDLLHKNFKPIENKFRFAVALDHTEDGDTEMIEEFLDKAVKGQCEGEQAKKEASPHKTQNNINFNTTRNRAHGQDPRRECQV